MFDGSPPGPRLSASHNQLETSLGQLDTSQSGDLSMRRRLHALMAQNFELQQAVAYLQNQLKSEGEAQLELRGQLREALEEISASDLIIETHKMTTQQLKDHLNRLEKEAYQAQQCLLQEQQAVSHLLQHNSNLQTETLLVSELKQQSQADYARTKLQLEQQKTTTEQIAFENTRLKDELALARQQLELQSNQLQLQQRELQVRQREMEEYEGYVLERLSEARRDPELHQHCLAQRDLYYCKYLKYKQKTGVYRRERDQMLAQLSLVGQEVGSQSMRRYVQ